MVSKSEENNAWGYSTSSLARQGRWEMDDSYRKSHNMPRHMELLPYLFPVTAFNEIAPNLVYDKGVDEGDITNG